MHFCISGKVQEKYAKMASKIQKKEMKSVPKIITSICVNVTNMKDKSLFKNSTYQGYTSDSDDDVEIKIPSQHTVMDKKPFYSPNTKEKIKLIFNDDLSQVELSKKLSSLEKGKKGRAEERQSDNSTEVETASDSESFSSCENTNSDSISLGSHTSSEITANNDSYETDGESDPL